MSELVSGAVPLIIQGEIIIKTRPEMCRYIL